MKAVNRCLVARCEICRRPDTREYTKEYSYYTLIYLIYPDGKVETIAGNTKLQVKSWSKSSAKNSDVK
ncbi:MAG: hypothetical protein WDO19_30515 [Bacteroidota bacterium]